MSKAKQATHTFYNVGVSPVERDDLDEQKQYIYIKGVLVGYVHKVKNTMELVLHRSWVGASNNRVKLVVKK